MTKQMYEFLDYVHRLQDGCNTFENVMLLDILSLVTDA